MFWIPLMMAANSLMQSQQQNDAIKAQNSTNKLNTWIANQQQQAASTVNAAKGALSRMTQSIQTQQAQRQYGIQYNQLEKQRVALGEQMTTGTFQNRINAAAQQGALQARASAAGVGGSTVDMLSNAMTLQANVDQAALDQEYSDNLYATSQAEQENIYGQYGILQQQNVYLDDVAASAIVGPAEIPKISTGTMLANAGLAFLKSYAELNSGGATGSAGASAGASAGSYTSGALKSWFSSGSGANSFFGGQ